MISDSLHQFIQGIPKAELHIHIEGTLEPELLFKLAKRNGIQLNHTSVEALRKAYNFNNLQEFLDIYYAGAKVLVHEQDFYDVTWAYLKKIHGQNVVHTEIFFDPQSHTHRGIKLGNVVSGIQNALNDGKKKWGITSRVIPNFLRHLSEEDAFRTFDETLKFKHLFAGFGLDSSELGHPPSKFERVFKRVRSEGFLTFAHAGEEGPAQNVWDSINLLQVTRIDHGVRSVKDETLLYKLAEKQIPLTVCPLSNLKLQVVNQMEDLPLRTLLDYNILATINSDDPAYFGGYINENFEAITKAFHLNKKDILSLAENSFKASLLSDERKDFWIKQLERYFKTNN